MGTEVEPKRRKQISVAVETCSVGDAELYAGDNLQLLQPPQSSPPQPFQRRQPVNGPDLEQTSDSPATAVYTQLSLEITTRWAKID